MLRVYVCIFIQCIYTLYIAYICIHTYIYICIYTMYFFKVYTYAFKLPNFPIVWGKAIVSVSISFFGVVSLGTIFQKSYPGSSIKDVLYIPSTKISMYSVRKSQVPILVLPGTRFKTRNKFIKENLYNQKLILKASVSPSLKYTYDIQSSLKYARLPIAPNQLTWSQSNGH